MPKIQRLYHLEIRPEQFLEACSSMELLEIDQLLYSPRFQDKMNQERANCISKNTDDFEAIQAEARQELAKYHGQEPGAVSEFPSQTK